MRRGPFLILAGFAAVTALGTSMSASPVSRRHVESDVRAANAVIDALDRCVQDRFIRIDKGFGLSRVAIAMHNIHLFIPVNDAERGVVRELDAMRARVVMYLASWQRPRTGPGSDAIPPLIQGPVLVNPAPHVVRMTPYGAPFEVDVNPRLLRELPNETALTAQASASLMAFADASSREFEVGGWRFVARPVRASAETCLACHNRQPSTIAASRTSDTAAKVFRLGDPLGAVLYGYQTFDADPVVANLAGWDHARHQYRRTSSPQDPLRPMSELLNAH
jgi:hypothetical protein